jgi:hypothetical protein
MKKIAPLLILALTFNCIVANNTPKTESNKVLLVLPNNIVRLHTKVEYFQVNLVNSFYIS